MRQFGFIEGAVSTFTALCASFLPLLQREVEAWTSMNVVVFHGNATALDAAVQHEFRFIDPTTKTRVLDDVPKFHVRGLSLSLALLFLSSLLSLSVTHLPCPRPPPRCWSPPTK